MSYSNCEPLTPDDIAEVVVFAAGRRENVVMADTLIFPSHQVRDILYQAPIAFHSMFSHPYLLFSHKIVYLLTNNNMMAGVNISYAQKLIGQNTRVYSTYSPSTIRRNRRLYIHLSFHIIYTAIYYILSTELFAPDTMPRKI